MVQGGKMKSFLGSVPSTPAWCLYWLQSAPWACHRYQGQSGTASTTTPTWQSYSCPSTDRYLCNALDLYALIFREIKENMIHHNIIQHEFTGDFVA